MQHAIVGVALAGGAWLATAAYQTMGLRQALVTIIGFAAGIALYHAAFGFTSAWRRALLEQRCAGLKAQVLMLAVTCAAFFPMLAAGTVLGSPVGGFVFPVGAALALGAFAFGIGMQLGGGCGSGTLYTAGGGSIRMLVTLAAFIAGSVLAAAHFPVWSAWPALPAWSVVDALGAPAALVVVAVMLLTAWITFDKLERRRHGVAEPLGWSGRLLSGPWPLVAGALALALVNIATLAVSGAPWGITSAFALWGSKIVAAAGVDVAAWPFWSGNTAITDSLLADRTSMMDFGLMLGALAAAGLASTFRPSIVIGAGPLAAAIVGGLLMGYGARLAMGCNIGAFFSGIASGSLHGLAWLVFALAGNMIGIRLRPSFGMA